ARDAQRRSGTPLRRAHERDPAARARTCVARTCLARLSTDAGRSVLKRAGHVLLHARRIDFGAVDVAARVGREPMRAGLLSNAGIEVGVRYECRDHTRARAAHSNAAHPAGMALVVRLVV